MTDIKHALENALAKFIINTFPDALKLNALAPHCDNCGWTDSEKHAYDETWVNAHIGMTCPQCNHVVITEQDAADVKALHEKLNHENNDDNASIVLHSNNRELKKIENIASKLITILRKGIKW